MFCLEKNYNRPPIKINIKIGFALLVIPSWLQYCKHSTSLKTQLYCVSGMNDCYKYQKIPLLNYILHTMEAFIQRKNYNKYPNYFQNRVWTQLKISKSASVTFYLQRCELKMYNKQKLFLQPWKETYTDVFNSLQISSHENWINHYF